MTYLVPVLLLLCAACSPSLAGNLQLRDQVMNCTGVVNPNLLPLYDPSGLVISRTGPNKVVLSGSLQLLHNVTSNLSVTVDVTRTENGAITGVFLLTINEMICGNLRKAQNIFQRIIKDAFGAQKMCPLSAGTYTLEGKGLDPDYTTFLNDPNARYIIDWTLSSGIYSTCIRLNTRYVA